MSCASRLTICAWQSSCSDILCCLLHLLFKIYTFCPHLYSCVCCSYFFFSSSAVVFLCFCALYNYHTLAYKKINYNMDLKSFCLSLNSYCEKAVIILLLLLLPLNQNYYYYYHYHVHIIIII